MPFRRSLQSANLLRLFRSVWKKQVYFSRPLCTLVNILIASKANLVSIAPDEDDQHESEAAEEVADVAEDVPEVLDTCARHLHGSMNKFLPQLLG